MQGIFGDILKAIAHCHAAHVCHRDLKFLGAFKFLVVKSTDATDESLSHCWIDFPGIRTS